tara:strand:- start:311 stop:1162 length:852 start_codon:yes stop_codon:yes gene_type:complete
MLGTYFYHEIIRKTIISFGTLFNNIHIKQFDKSGAVTNQQKVGLSYGPMQKFLAKIQQQDEITKSVAISLPRMSFEMTSIQYDSTRKAGVTQTFKAVDSSDGNKMKKVFMPVPYNIGFELNIFSKLNDDALQIVEQILPFFQPSFNLTLDLLNSIGEKRDTPVVLDSIDFQDDYEGSFQTRRALIYTLRFTVKTYLFGPIADSTDGLIRKVQVDTYTNTNINTATREMRYTTTPKALEDKNSDGQINSADDALLEPSDDFGFNEDWDFFQDSKTYSPTQQQDI